MQRILIALLLLLAHAHPQRRVERDHDQVGGRETQRRDRGHAEHLLDEGDLWAKQTDRQGPPHAAHEVHGDGAHGIVEAQAIEEHDREHHERPAREASRVHENRIAARRFPPRRNPRIQSRTGMARSSRKAYGDAKVISSSIRPAQDLAPAQRPWFRE